MAGWTRSVRELVTLFRHAALLVTNDGGPAQFSALTRVPTVALFGPETPALYAPLGGRAECLHHALPCSPCLTAYNHRRTPCDGDNQCMKRIPPDEVLARARAIAGAAPVPIAGRLRDPASPALPPVVGWCCSSLSPSQSSASGDREPGHPLSGHMPAARSPPQPRLNLALALAVFVATINNFAWNRLWAWRDRREHAYAVVLQFVQYGLACWLASCCSS
jgi:hypothetical protein